jgi:hypothetical protein
MATDRGAYVVTTSREALEEAEAFAAIARSVIDAEWRALQAQEERHG